MSIESETSRMAIKIGNKIFSVVKRLIKLIDKIGEIIPGFVDSILTTSKYK